MTEKADPFRFPLPRGWPGRVKSAMLHIISLAQYAVVYTRGWAVNSRVARVRLSAGNDRLRQNVAQLTEEIRINDARMMRIPAHKRPHYAPTERMSILELRAAREWGTQWTSPCAKPLAIVAGQPGDRLALHVDFHDGKRHLPIVSLKRAA